jgi:hypothetical protein
MLPLKIQQNWLHLGTQHNWAWWLMSLILAKWQAEIGRITVQGQLWQKKSSQDSISTEKAGYNGVCLSSQMWQEV